jgi:hypothetical protein
MTHNAKNNFFGVKKIRYAGLLHVIVAGSKSWRIEKNQSSSVMSL